MVAKFCEDDCKALCDFCKHFLEKDLESGEDGICKLTKEEVNRLHGEGCDGFVCFRIEDEE